MAIKNIGPETAKEILDKEDDAVYIDVRTEPEFLNGHVPKAINIPVVWPDVTRQLKPNPDFVKADPAHFAKDKRIFGGCQAEGRSHFAAELLSNDGLLDVSN